MEAPSFKEVSAPLVCLYVEGCYDAGCLQDLSMTRHARCSVKWGDEVIKVLRCVLESSNWIDYEHTFPRL